MPPEAATTALPQPVLHALGQIASELADVPRECCADRVEMLLWLRRMARRVEGVQAMRVPAALGGPKGSCRKSVKRQAGKAAIARSAAEAL